MFKHLLQDDDLEIARLVRDAGPISRAEIARRLAMSPSTVGRAVDGLIEAGLLMEFGAAAYPTNGSASSRPSGAGRPSILLRFNSSMRSVLTVDLRLTEAYAAITDLAGNRLTSIVRPLPADPRASLAGLVELIRALLAGSPGLPPVEAIAIGAPSIVDERTGEIEWAPSLGWEHVPLRALLEEEFGRTALVENDVNLAALGEYWKGAGQAVDRNMVFVSVGTGIGAGIILNGQLYRGATHAAGEVAYFITDVNVLRDHAAHTGNLESRVGNDGLLRMAQLVAQRYPTSGLARRFSTGHAVRTGEILALAEQGDQAAQVVVNELIDTLTIVIGNISVLLDPEVIVLGGPNNWKWPALIPAIQNRVGSALLRPIHLLPSRLGNDALILGGTYSALGMLAI